MKNLAIRIFLALAATAVTGVCLAQSAYPSRPIKLVVPQAPGSGTDVIARMWADFVGKHLGAAVVVDNRAGANGVLGVSNAKQQQPDGYTLLLAGASQLVFNPQIYKDIPYQIERDFDGIALVLNTPLLLIASEKSGIASFDDFIAKSRKAPGKLNYATAGIGNSTHLSLALISMRKDLTMVHVPYNGAAAGLKSVVAGETDVMADVLNTAIVQVKAGRVKPLALIGNKPDPDLPGVPTIAQVGVGEFPMVGWYALLAPKGTPRPIIAQLNEATQAFLQDPASLARITQMKMEPLPSSPDDVQAWTTRDSRVWGPLIKELAISNTPAK